MAKSESGEADRPSVLVVVGSVNQDYFAYVTQFPAPGETVLAVGGAVATGGKGANQAMAAALLGCPVTFIGAVGSDAAADSVVSDLEACGVDTRQVTRLANTSTGAAYVAVDGGGENTIIVQPGANAVLRTSVLEHALGSVIDASSGIVVLCQGELNADVTRRACAMASASTARFVLNLAPVTVDDEVILSEANPLILNEGEAQDLLARFGIAVPTGEEVHGGATAALLSDRLNTSVIVTLGRHGAAVASAGQTWLQPAPAVSDVIDTTGAGDAFVGALAAALCAGHDLAESVRIGVAAGSHAVRIAGTTPSYPRGIPLTDLLERTPPPNDCPTTSRRTNGSSSSERQRRMFLTESITDLPDLL